MSFRVFCPKLAEKWPLKWAQVNSKNFHFCQITTPPYYIAHSCNIFPSPGWWLYIWGCRLQRVPWGSKLSKEYHPKTPFRPQKGSFYGFSRISENEDYMVFSNFRKWGLHAVFLSQHTVFPPCSRISENEDYLPSVVLFFRKSLLFTHRFSKYMYLMAKYTKYKMTTTKFSIWRHIICEICPFPYFFGKIPG